MSELQRLEIAVPGSERLVPVIDRLVGSRPAHAVQFYENDHFLDAAVADYLAEGLRAGDVDVVIASPARREALVMRLRSKGIDPLAATYSGKLVMLDARETLGTFMAQATPDRQRFESNVGSMIGRYIGANAPAGVRAYGEMVDLLWQDGNTEGAIQLEELWNELQGRYSFSLLCAYAMNDFSTGAQAADFDRVCHAHSSVRPTERYFDLDQPGRLREVSQLQQRARALEGEIEQRVEVEERLRAALAARMQIEDRLRRALAEHDALLQRERAARAEAESANRAKSEFLTAMSHELRTPLNAIGGHMQLLEMGIHGPVTDAQRSALKRIERSQKQLLALINDVLNLKARRRR